MAVVYGNVDIVNLFLKNDQKQNEVQFKEMARIIETQDNIIHKYEEQLAKHQELFLSYEAKIRELQEKIQALEKK